MLNALHSFESIPTRKYEQELLSKMIPYYREEFNRLLSILSKQITAFSESSISDAAEESEIEPKSEIITGYMKGCPYVPTLCPLTIDKKYMLRY